MKRSTFWRSIRRRRDTSSPRTAFQRLQAFRQLQLEHLETRHLLAAENFFGVDLLQPADGQYVNAPEDEIAYANGVILQNVVLGNFDNHFAPPTLGNNRTDSFNATFDADASFDSGQSFDFVSAPASMTVLVDHVQDDGDTQIFETEMLQLDLSRGNLPAGTLIRESPTLQSLGETTIRTVPGGFMIASFFDIYTELSVDGGQSWTPNNGNAQHVELVPVATDSDGDDDGVDDDADNCGNVPNPNQEDSDGDGIGDACDEPDLDSDADGVPDDRDNCPNIFNPDQEDADEDGIGDVCEGPDADGDGDGVPDDIDNCPNVANPDQEDTDENGIGDACEEPDEEPDSDFDGVPDDVDNCPFTQNPDQEDTNGDGIGDVCEDDSDSDGDGVDDDVDNCPFDSNPDQTDQDENGIGDVCEEPAEIRGQVFEDANRNGIRDDGERGLEGWTIQLDFEANGTVEETETTDVNGDYSFVDLTPGLYRIREVVQSGWLQSTANPGDVTAFDGLFMTDVDFGNYVRDKIGVKRGNNYLRDVNGSGLWEGASDRFDTFGNATDTPLVGDWNGDGLDDIGIYRGKMFYQDLNGNGTWDGVDGGDQLRKIGNVGDVAIIGDWDGNGIDDIGVQRGNAFYLDASGDGVWGGLAGGDLFQIFGNAGDTPLAGDWDGDGSDEIGVHRLNQFYLDLSSNGGWGSGDVVYNFGNPSDVPLKGDWDGDGSDEIGAKRGNMFYLDVNGSGTWNGAPGDAVHIFGDAADLPLIGRWGPRNPLMAAGGEVSSSGDVAPLTSDALAPIVTQAIVLWANTGLSPAQIQSLQRVTFSIVNLPGAQLGLSLGGAILMDADAAGYGWFVDPTPEDSSEFSNSLTANPQSLDLLSAVLHELGHELGYDHDDDLDAMFETLAAGTRRLL